jgi:hypothetical protein
MEQSGGGSGAPGSCDKSLITRAVAVWRALESKAVCTRESGPYRAVPTLGSFQGEDGLGGHAAQVCPAGFAPPVPRAAARQLHLRVLPCACRRWRIF